MADPTLTRFDFHAQKFMHSEAVQEMDACEVGQYILLLCEAWLVGKDTTLPDSPKYLARTARVSDVSPSVLACFPVVETEWGPRRRNETLYGEWREAVKRSESGRVRAAARWGSVSEETPEGRNATALPQQCQGNATAMPRHSSGNAQPIPVRTVPLQAGSGPARPGSSQLISSRPSEGEEDKPGAAAPDPAPVNFKTFRITWQNLVGKLDKNQQTVKLFEDGNSAYGEYILDALKKWATPGTIGWLQEKGIKYPLGVFIKRLPELVAQMNDDKTRDPEMIEADKLAVSIPSVITPERMSAVDADIVRMAAEEERDREARRAAFSAKDSDVSVENVLDYLSED